MADEYAALVEKAKAGPLTLAEVSRLAVLTVELITPEQIAAATLLSSRMRLATVRVEGEA